MKNSIVITIAIALLVGATAFYGGMQYQQRQRPNFAGIRGGQNGQQFQGRGNFQGVRLVNGEIISQDDKSITVKLQDGSSKIVLLTDKTAINKSAQGSKSDLKVGEKVVVFGTTNSDGSVTAQNIQLNPILRGKN
ncbi:MAG: DUF5666 domain-containing protein [bacterium]|nr:DUF5666 domain-containing protein [bacterium]